MKFYGKKIKFLLCVVFIFLILFSFVANVYAAPSDAVGIPSIDINIGTAETPTETSSTLQILLLVTIISLAPSILILFTCFTRIIITLHFLRAALGTQQMPPTQILIGLALFLTVFIMSPTLTRINDEALTPYTDGAIGQEEFIDKAMVPIRDFMFAQVENKDLKLFASLSGEESYNSKEEIPTTVLAPSFILGELTKGFKIGFLLYIPFIAIDMVVASVLMAMGMMMLPPALISAPFKILLFVLVDGWSLVIESLLKTFK